MNNKVYAFALLFFPFLFPHQSVDAQNAKSLLWEISGNGLDQPSYLYGTMHVADKRAFQFSDEVMPAFNRSKAYVMELNMDKADPMAVMNAMKLKEGKLQDLFSTEEWNRLDTYFKEKLHASAEDFNDFGPFMVYSVVAQGQFKNQMKDALDLHFFNLAKEASKERFGLETVEEQIGAINRMPMDQQVKMLMEAIDEKKSGSKKAMNKMMKYYAKGDLDKLLELSAESEMGDEFEAALINERNHKMAERMVPHMEKQQTFVAVGALHLPGEEGVISLLRKAGYQVKAMN